MRRRCCATGWPGCARELALIADGRLDGHRLHELVEIQEAAVKQAANAPELSAMEASDAEGAVSDWLEERGITTNSVELSATLVAGGASEAWLDSITAAISEEMLEPAVRWIGYTVDTELLMHEIDDAVGRISGLVGAAKQYSQLDRAPGDSTCTSCSTPRWSC